MYLRTGTILPSSRLQEELQEE